MQRRPRSRRCLPHHTPPPHHLLHLRDAPCSTGSSSGASPPAPAGQAALRRSPPHARRSDAIETARRGGRVSAAGVASSLIRPARASGPVVVAACVARKAAAPMRAAKTADVPTSVARTATDESGEDGRRQARRGRPPTSAARTGTVPTRATRTERTAGGARGEDVRCADARGEDGARREDGRRGGARRAAGRRGCARGRTLGRHGKEGAKPTSTSRCPPGKGRSGIGADEGWHARRAGVEAGKAG